MVILLQDLRYALRSLRRSPGFTLAAVLTLALGIGANTAIFSVIDAVMLRPLPYPEADRLAMLWAERGAERRLLSIPDIEDFRARSRVFAGIGIVRQQSVSLTGRDAPDRLSGAYVEASALSVLGARASRGRLFRPEETVRGTAANVAVLSYAAWTTRFGGDTGIVGRTLVLDGLQRQVIGVTVEGFRDPLAPVDVWLPLPTAPGPSWYVREAKNVWAWGRLRPGVSVAEARRDLSSIAGELAAQYPSANAGVGATAVSLRDTVVGNPDPLLTIFAAVGVVLLIACANLTNLQLARATSRRRELSVRAALGAGRSRLVRQLLTESLLLAALGCVAGLVLARWSLDTLVAMVPGGLATVGAVTLDVRVLSFAVAVTIGSGLLAGLAPALSAARPDLKEALNMRAGDGRARRRLDVRTILITAQLAVCVVLLVGAGLLARSLAALQHVDTGFDSRNLLSGEFRLPASKYRTTGEITQFLNRALDEVRRVPGVRAAALVRSVPLSGNFGLTAYEREGAPAAVVPPSALQNNVSDGFFSTLGIRFVEGRDFDATDRAETPHVAIVSEEFVRREWPGQPALGKRVKLLDAPQPEWVTVVGVVANIKQRALGDPPSAQLYQPEAQATGTFNSVVVRTDGDPAALAKAVRAAIWSVDRDQPVWRVQPMSSFLRGQTALPRFTLILTASFATLALALALVGVYGVMSYVLMQRTREVGIRMALGARRTQVVRMLLGGGARVVAVATAVGLFGAWGASQLLRKQLFGVPATDPLTFAAVPVMLAIVALLACYLPARRAARVDPTTALRSE
jgi:putative ABC transport system permease protein